MAILDGLNLPTDIKKLNINALKELAEELRAEILSTTSKNGGHLASNLGIIETTIALYYTFDFPSDKLIFDVGHQCYAHKILSGRKDSFSSIRTDGGISGFPDREESEYDSFVAGHAGTSIAAGLGYCAARDSLKEDYTVINVVGDGSIANGLNLEAISVKDVKPKKYIVILNDNGMSISKNTNGLYQMLSKGTTKRSYAKSKRIIKKIFGTSIVTRGLAKIRNLIKHVLGKNQYFENYGFKYVGIVDGNDMGELVKILSRVKLASEDKAILLHVKTTKGKGYEKAEEQAELYHGVGVDLKNESGEFSKALGEKLNDMIDSDSRIVAITAGMKDGTGLSAVEQKHPKNFYDVGIAEEYAVTSAAGMAAGGLKPIVCIYSTFLQRGYDQIIHDVCLQNLPVVFCLDRAGLVGKDGKTHQGVFDLSYLTHIPNLTVFAPTTANELKDILDYAISLNKPVAIRYPKNHEGEREVLGIKDGRWETIKKGDKVSILAVGPKMLKVALGVSETIDGVGVISARTVKPLCEKTLRQIKDTLVVTLEENSVIGGFGGLVSAYYRKENINVKLLSFGVKDEFIGHGSIKCQLESNGLTVDDISSAIISADDTLKRKG
ncbi:MAG: 1-deoxy-D-xylulose-5-phosphate synthase [Clostridiales bacterium]|nr:1-deoxy-D-xylulose-5-phosphate synthase [Clostridiales bacterium]